jgi:hypothetical protein
LGGSATTTVHEVYDPAANTWSTAASLPAGRSHYGSTVNNGRIYIIGGDNGAPTSSCMQYDLASDSWLPLFSMAQARYQSAVGLINGKIYASQGNSGSVLNTTEEYPLPRTVYLAEKI